MRIGQRKHRQKGEGLAAASASAAADSNPVVMLVVRLLAPAPVTNDRVPLTNRTMAYDDLVAVFGPANRKLFQRDRHWDEEDRYLKGFAVEWTAKISASSEALLLKENPTEENIACYWLLFWRNSEYWPVIRLLATVDFRFARSSINLPDGEAAKLEEAKRRTEH